MVPLDLAVGLGLRLSTRTVLAPAVAHVVADLAGGGSDAWFEHDRLRPNMTRAESKNVALGHTSLVVAAGDGPGG